MKYIITIIIIVILTITLKIGLEKQDKVDCYKWQRYEQTYIDFQSSEETRLHCESLGIEIIPSRNDYQKYNLYPTNEN